MIVFQEEAERDDDEQMSRVSSRVKRTPSESLKPGIVEWARAVAGKHSERTKAVGSS